MLRPSVDQLDSEKERIGDCTQDARQVSIMIQRLMKTRRGQKVAGCSFLKAAKCLPETDKEKRIGDSRMLMARQQPETEKEEMLEGYDPKTNYNMHMSLASLAALA